MKGYIANTDYDWYAFLRTQVGLDEVNFWQPSGRLPFKHAIPPGAPFFSRLKKPHSAIAGFGFFNRHFHLPEWLAWKAYEKANGAATFTEMRDRIGRLNRGEPGDALGQREIGCTIISQPIFFDPGNWIPQPEDWPLPVQQGKTYDLSVGEGKRVFEQCQVRAQQVAHGNEVADGMARFGEGIVVRPRLGQGTFRVAVLDAYGRACAVTREHSLPALESSHIRPFAQDGPHDVSNGLSLRADIHNLFDAGYVTVTPDHHFEVSRRLKEEFANGRTYYPLHGTRIHLPHDSADWPSRAQLEWHNEHRYRG